LLSENRHGDRKEDHFSIPVLLLRGSESVLFPLACCVCRKDFLRIYIRRNGSGKNWKPDFLSCNDNFLRVVFITVKS